MLDFIYEEVRCSESVVTFIIMGVDGKSVVHDLCGRDTYREELSQCNTMSGPLWFMKKKVHKKKHKD